MSAALDEATRRRYLDAMGIPVWLARADLDAGPDHGAAGAASHAPPDLDALRAEVAGCTACALHEGRTQTVFGVGNPAARCMIIGEGPGAQEDRKGEPFVGRAGRLLDAMLLASGLERADVYIANIVKCRPPGNRDPRPDEVAACSAYMRRQIELIAPTVILAVGRVAAQNLLGLETPLGRMRGRQHVHQDSGTPVVVTYHPAYLLRSPGDKGKAWADLRQVRALLGMAP